MGVSVGVLHDPQQIDFGDLYAIQKGITVTLILVNYIDFFYSGLIEFYFNDLVGVVESVTTITLATQTASLDLPSQQIGFRFPAERKFSHSADHNY